MGCAASTPENVIDGPLPNNNQNAGDHVTENLIENVKEAVDISKDSQLEEPIQESSLSEFEPSFKGLETVEEPIVIKANTQDMVRSVSEADSEEGIRTECKKGYVSFEVNLDGQVEPCLDAAKKPLPKRLKHLEPLQGAPKLTAEELNEKLERAEQKRLKALAKRKSHISRRVEKDDRQAPNQTGDAPVGEESKGEATESQSRSSSHAEIVSEANSSTVLRETAESPESLTTSEETEANISQPTFEVVDLNNSNNNANVSPSNLDQNGLSTSAKLVNKRLVVRQALEDHQKTRRQHPLNAVQEVDERNDD